MARVAAERNSVRPERPSAVDFDFRNKLAVRNLDPSFQYRWVNNEPGRVYEMTEMGYELVQDPMKIGDGAEVSANQLGSAVQRQVGQGTLAYLMRIPRDLYDRMQAAKLADIRAIEEALQGPATEGQYGNVSIS